MSTKTRDCVCNPLPLIDDCRTGVCRYGYCKEWKCRTCHKVAFGAGPMLCRCDWDRRQYYPDMGPKSPVAVKQSASRKRRKWR